MGKGVIARQMAASVYSVAYLLEHATQLDRERRFDLAWEYREAVAIRAVDHPNRGASWAEG